MTTATGERMSPERRSGMSFTRRGRRLRPCLALLLVCLASAATLHPTGAQQRDRASRTGDAAYVDDASRLNRTHVAKIVDIAGDRAGAEELLRRILARARREHRPVSISGARHSMGGQTIIPEGIIVNMLPYDRMELDASRRLLHVGAGARWSQIIPYLDAHGLSVEVMQSFHNFTVGGSLSVNAHGWQPNSPPISSTVDGLRLVKADGSVVRLGRRENAELFALVLGGYGLFGVILDVDLRVVPNERYKPDMEIVSAGELPARYREKVTANVGMAYARLCVVPGEKRFLRETILTVHRRAPCAPAEIPPLKEAGGALLRREIYRAQRGNPLGKELRWQAETQAGRMQAKRYVSRNQLLDEGVEVYEERSAARTDILQEYFIAPEQVPRFLMRVRKIVPRHHGDLLNVTVRHVLEDRDSFLRYADREMFAFVMLFNEPRTPRGDSQMEAMTRELIDAALDSGGRYYLPYRLHATKEQFARAYPQAREFFERKRRYDPGEIFQNQLYAKYGRP